MRAESSNTVALTEQVAADLDLQITSSIQQGTGTFGGTVGLAYDSGAGQWKLDGALAGAVQNFQGVSAQHRRLGN